MLTLGKPQVSNRFALKHFASRKGVNRYDLTEKRRVDFNVKLSKINGTFNFSFFYIKSANFLRTLPDVYTFYNLHRKAYSVPQIKNTPMFASPFIKASAFKIAKRFLTLTKKSFFKHFAKRKLFSNRVLTYNKIWQKQFVHKFSKTFFPYASKILTKYKRNLKKSPQSMRKKNLNGANNLIFSADRPLLLIVLQRFFGNVSLGFCLHLLNNHYCAVDGVCVTDPSYRLQSFSVLTFNIMPIYYVLVLLLSRRFIKKKTKNIIHKTKLKKYLMSGLCEISFKSGEILFLPTTPDKTLMASLFFQKQQKDGIFLQRVFKKQQKFGLKE